jgi:hypothetical protein
VWLVRGTHPHRCGEYVAHIHIDVARTWLMWVSDEAIGYSLKVPESSVNEHREQPQLTSLDEERHCISAS